MSETSNRSFMPAHRNILVDISEASGALCQLHEVVDEFGLYRVMTAIDAGLQLYEADEVLFVQMQAFRLYCEMLDRDDGGFQRDVTVSGGGGEPLQASINETGGTLGEPHPQ